MVDGEPHVVVKPRVPLGVASFQPTEVLPGLLVRQMEPRDLGAFEAAAQAGGVDWITPEMLTQWRTVPDYNWLTVVEWRGRVLQFDFFHLGPFRGDVNAGLTLRPSRDRARWFWPLLRRPVLEQLLALGYQRMHSRIRGDRADWVAVMRELWDAKEDAPLPSGRVPLRYDLKRCLARSSGVFPERRSASVAGVDEADLDGARALAEQEWGSDHPRLPFVLGLLDDMWHLDRATFLAIGSHVRALRWRWGTTAAVAVMTPMRATTPQTSALTREWAKRAGYSTLRIFSAPGQITGIANQQLAIGGFRQLARHARTGSTEWEARL